MGGVAWPPITQFVFSQPAQPFKVFASCVSVVMFCCFEDDAHDSKLMARQVNRGIWPAVCWAPVGRALFVGCWWWVAVVGNQVVGRFVLVDGQFSQMIGCQLSPVGC